MSPFFIFTCLNPMPSFKHDYTLREIEYDLLNKGYSVEAAIFEGHQALKVTDVKDWGFLFRMAEALGQEKVMYLNDRMKRPASVMLKTGEHFYVPKN